MILKNLLNKIIGGGDKVHRSGGDGQGAGALSPEERKRRLAFAAKFTVKKYGSVIERLAKE